MTDPILMTWQGDAFTPTSPFWQRKADKLFVIGQSYRMVEVEERSSASHRHYFAMLNDAFANLPESLADEYPSVERLRKVALIRTGYADSQTFVCASKMEAQRMAAFIRPIDEYSIVEARGATVTRWTAKSQSTRAMGASEFQESKDKTLDWISSLIGTTRARLEQNGAA